MIEFTVIGRPQPAGSKRAYVPKGHSRAVIVDANPKAKPWKQEIAETAQAVFDRQYGPMGLTEYVEFLARPMVADFTFYLTRPVSHYGTGRNAHLVKKSAPQFPATKPDVDKLSRGVLDALTGVLWRDDSQVVRKTVRKLYGTPERVEIRVEPVERCVV